MAGFKEEWRFRNCPWCGLRDAALIVSAQPIVTSPAGKSQRQWAFLGCPRCGEPVLVEIGAPNASQPADPLKVIPASRPEDDIAHIPPEVAGYFSNARTALDAGLPSLAAVALRQTLEAAAKARGVELTTENGRHRPLVDLVKELVAGGHITTEFSQALDHVRVLGNAGAHASSETVDEADVKRAYRFTTVTLRNLFEIPSELAELNKEKGAESP